MGKFNDIYEEVYQRYEKTSAIPGDYVKIRSNVKSSDWYKNLDEAIALSKLGKGSLVSTIVTADYKQARQYVIGAATHHGRILVLNNECAKENTGHGSPLPLLVHGGPGRAGGGEEMGGIRGVKHYLQRTAIQGSPTTLTEVTNVYQPNAVGKKGDKHPFKKYFEELQIGEQIVTEKRVITS